MNVEDKVVFGISKVLSESWEEMTFDDIRNLSAYLHTIAETITLTPYKMKEYFKEAMERSKTQ